MKTWTDVVPSSDESVPSIGLSWIEPRRSRDEFSGVITREERERERERERRGGGGELNNPRKFSGGGAVSGSQASHQPRATGADATLEVNRGMAQSTWPEHNVCAPDFAPSCRNAVGDRSHQASRQDMARHGDGAFPTGCLFPNAETHLGGLGVPLRTQPFVPVPPPTLPSGGGERGVRLVTLTTSTGGRSPEACKLSAWPELLKLSLMTHRIWSSPVVLEQPRSSRPAMSSAT